MIEVTSKTLLKQGQIDFAASVEVDLPFRAKKVELDDAFTGEQANSADHLVVIDVALAKAERRVLGITKVPSQVLVRYRTEPNPEYNFAQNTVNNSRLVVQQASMGKMSADSQWCQGLGCIAKAQDLSTGQGTAAFLTQVKKSVLSTIGELIPHCWTVWQRS